MEEGAKVGLDGDVLRADYFKVVTPFIASAIEHPPIVSKGGVPRKLSIMFGKCKCETAK